MALPPSRCSALHGWLREARQEELTVQLSGHDSGPSAEPLDEMLRGVRGLRPQQEHRSPAPPLCAGEGGEPNGAGWARLRGLVGQAQGRGQPC